ncbi:LytR/AlgR family response regulator transcription factor [Pedobacter sp.]|uniref:LytR/AlgR family response regulator transcription factor n=1 Tax=Pedobacter sp. TaxID=1411316 RepID=UPI003D7FA3F1
MRVLIIEDEELAAATLQDMLQNLKPNLKVQAVLGTVEAAVNWLTNHSADLIFMDIHLGDGESFQIFQQVKINCPVIYTTAYDQYSLKAFKNQGIDYLLKPFDEEEVAAALTKLGDLTTTVQAFASLLSAETHAPMPAIQTRFLVKAGKLLRTVQAADVAYFMAEDKYLFLVTTAGQNYIIEETIGSMEPKLDDRNFFRINRKFIIHINAIQEMHKLPRNRVRITLSPLPDGVAVIVSEDRSAAFKQWLNR